MKRHWIILVSVAAIALVGVLAAQEKTPDPSPAADGGARQGRQFEMPPLETREIRRQEPIEIERFELGIIADGSAAGRPNDVLITFVGQGFVLTSLGPRVLFGDELVFESTEINRTGTELYLVLSREELDRLLDQRFERAVVENPGGSEDSPTVRASIAVSSQELADRLRTAGKVMLVYRDSFYERRSAEGEPQG